MNNRYCHYRALELDKRGLRERVAKIKEAAKTPFAIGEFEVIVEPVPGREAEAAAYDSGVRQAGRQALVQIDGLRAAGEEALPEPVPEGHVAPVLDLCRACQQYIYPHETTCPHCGADVAKAAVAYEAAAQRRRELMASMTKLLRGHEPQATHVQ